MTTSVRRYGIETEDPEREERFRRLEEEVAKRSLAQLSVGENAQMRARSPTPQVQGIRVDRNIIGGLGVQWSPLEIGDIRRYEIEAATDQGFRNVVESENLTANSYVFRSLDPETTYYIRVRGVNSRGEPGPYSSVLNSQSGQATFTNLERGAATGITTVTQTSGFNPAVLNSSNPQAQFLRTRISFETTNDTFIVGISKTDFSVLTGSSISIRLLVDGETKVEYENTNTSGFNSSGRITVPGLNVPILLGQGSHTFAFEIEIQNLGGGWPTVTPVALTYSVCQLRN